MSRSGPPSINAKPANPVLRIPFSRADLGAIEPSGGGGNYWPRLRPNTGETLSENFIRHETIFRPSLQTILARWQP